MNIILFDGDCNFCNHSVQFIIKRDKNKQFKFASVESKVGQEYFDKFEIPRTINSMVLIEDNNYFIKSTAALMISRKLDGLWKLCYSFIIIPESIRNVFYDLVAKNRHKLQKNHCVIPTKDDLDRFL